MAFQILLAEDNPGDVRLFREALKTCNLVYDLAVAEDGQKAIAWVKNACQTGNRPDLIVLDINLPRHKGDEVLRQVRAEPAVRDVPVIVMTSSASPTDQTTASLLGADIYLQKPSDLEELLEVAKVIEGVLRRSKPACQ